MDHLFRYFAESEEGESDGDLSEGEQESDGEDQSDDAEQEESNDSSDSDNDDETRDNTKANGSTDGREVKEQGDENKMPSNSGESTNIRVPILKKLRIM